MAKTSTVDRSQMNVKMYVQHQDKGVDEQFGTPKLEWSDLVDSKYRRVWVVGKVETLTGGEFETARKKVARATHRVTVPFMPFLNEKHRFIVAKTRKVLEIGLIINEGMADKKQTIICEETIAVD